MPLIWLSALCAAIMVILPGRASGPCRFRAVIGLAGPVLAAFIRRAE